MGLYVSSLQSLLSISPEVVGLFYFHHDRGERYSMVFETHRRANEHG